MEEIKNFVFAVDYKTIDNILSIALKNNILKCNKIEEGFFRVIGVNTHKDWLNDLENLGRDFLETNIKSLDCRYSYSLKHFAYRLNYVKNYKLQDSKPTLGQAIKSLECLIYNSSEIVNCMGTVPYKYLEGLQRMKILKDYLIEAFLNLECEYKNAEWHDKY